MTHHPNDNAIVDLLQPILHNAVIAGGAARLWYCGKPVKSHDIDIFFNSMAAFNEATRYFKEVHKSKSTDLYLFDPNTYIKVVHETDKAITYIISGYMVQLIKTPYSDIDQLFGSFDMTICMVALKNGEFVVHPEFKDDVEKKRIVLKSIKENTVRRVSKYMMYGFDMDANDFRSLLENNSIEWVAKMIGHDEY